ncbi:MAG: hypothetical protein NVS3B10_21250 [Polyangiales bacterium]
MTRRGIERASEARREFTWGREPREELVFRAHDPPARVAALFPLVVSEYLTTKGRHGEPTIYTHRHDPPFALVTTEPGRGAASSLVSSRTCPRYRRPLFILGELVRLADDDGHAVKFRSGLFFLCGDPITRDMFVLPKRTDATHFWIKRGASSYTITERGIEG